MCIVKEQNNLVIIDASETEAIEARIANLRAERPSCRIVVITASPTWQGARAAFEAGATDYLPKSLGEEGLRRALNEIAFQ
jgi:DNA-binding NarL/FixJ family response regulator